MAVNKIKITLIYASTIANNMGPLKMTRIYGLVMNCDAIVSMNGNIFSDFHI